MHSRYTGVSRNDQEELDMGNMQVKTLPTNQAKTPDSYKPSSEADDHGEPARETVGQTIRNFALDETTAHGFPYIFRARSYLGRFLWALIFFVGVVGTIYQGTVLVLKFLDYPVNVEVKIVTRPTLEFPSVTVCNTNKLRYSAIDKSRHRQMLVVDQTTSLPYYAPCLEDDFACKTQPVCIKRYLMCDGIRQCGENDPSDEYNCDYSLHTCPNKQFHCIHSGSSMGMCIPAKKKCNRRKDCYEGEDEDECECKANEFKCEQRGGCIPKKNVCDGRPDCRDSSDESRNTCGRESNPRQDCRSPSWFLCSSGDQCIVGVFACDGFNDCRDGSDEAPSKCVVMERDISPTPVLLGPQCDSSRFACIYSFECIPEGWACDGSLDCEDGTDEAPELCGRPICNHPKVPCEVGGGCGVPCDLSPECLGGIDEINCTCNVSRNETDDSVLQKFTCVGVSSKQYGKPAPAVQYVASCGNGYTDPVLTPYYHCDGKLDCYNPLSSLPEPCKTVYSECYTSDNGHDYRGMESNQTCLPWSHPDVASRGYTGSNYWELEGVEPGSTVDHNFCRNPGGEGVEPGCYTMDENGQMGYHHCSLAVPPEETCHDAMFDVALANPVSTGDSTHGRIEVSYGTGITGSISDSNWTLEDADVVCRQLGFPDGALRSESHYSEPGTGRIVLKDVQCTGREKRLIDCFYRLGTERDSDHRHDVSVVCNNSTTSSRRSKRDVESQADAETASSEACPSCSSKPEVQTPTSGYEVPADCGNGGFRCQSGQCIRHWQVCNKFPDCPDGSDEWLLECEDVVTKCSIDEFQCKETNGNGRRDCFPRSFLCDNYNDCGDPMRELQDDTPRASDEQRCPGPGETPPENYYKCKNVSKFVHEYDMCNTVRDCFPEGDDEENCQSSSTKGEVEDPFQNSKWYDPYKSMLKKKDHYLFNNFTSAYRASPFSRVKGEDPPDWSGFMTYSAMPDYSDLIRVLKLSKDEVRQTGHQREDFILQCTYEQQKCNISLFGELQDEIYGNCYTFNGNNSGIQASKTGSRHGLHLTLFLEQSEYISIYGQEAGVRVTITPSHIRPDPAEDGMTVKPGAVTSVGLRYNYVLRKGDPYGQCEKPVDKTKINADGEIRETSQSEKYDRKLCQKYCVHKHILEYCDCSDTLELRVDANKPRCKMLNETQEVCRQLVYFLHQNNKLDCSCPQKCSDVYYTKTSSMSKWPSKKFVRHLLRNIHAINEKTKHLNEENIYENIVRLEVYYEELNYESTKEVPAYEATSLFGDIGGIVGLYIGFSLITACEFVALALKLFKNFCFKPVLKV